MAPMATRLRLVLSCLLVAFLGGCGGGSQTTSPPDAPTVTGGIVGPAGTGGGPGGVGGGGGTGGQSATSAAVNKCIPGTAIACACVTGQTGAQTCTSAGTFAACACVAPAVDAGSLGGAGGTTATTTRGTGGQSVASSDAGPASAGGTTYPAAGGQSGVSPDASAPAACVPGASAKCYCSTGRQGAQICTAAGTFGPCDCVPPPPDASPVAELVITGTNDLGTVVCGTTSAPVILTIRNTGETEAAHVSVATNGAPDWQVVDDQCTGQTLAPLVGQCTSGTVFTPHETLPPGAYAALLTASFAGGEASFPLKATAVEPCGIHNWPTCPDAGLAADSSPDVPSPDAHPDVAVLPGLFAPTGSMTVARESHTATLLQDGKVLIAGGCSDSGCLASAELYDPATGTFTATGSYYDTHTGMSEARVAHTATLLGNGSVLIAGGYGVQSTPLASAELYDPATGTFTATGSIMTTARAFHTVTLLPSGKVLIAGGESGNGSRLNASLARAELYDPATGTFTATGSMTVGRAAATATLLGNGKVLITGGGGDNLTPLASAELYDTATGTFTATGNMTVARAAHTATLLGNGKVLIAGGYDINDNTLTSAELYDPSAGTFTATGSPSVARGSPATLLGNGKVLIAGGWNINDNTLASAELYDPATGTFTATGNMTVAREDHTSTLLQDGKVLIAGGDGVQNTPLASAELFEE